MKIANLVFEFIILLILAYFIGIVGEMLWTGIMVMRMRFSVFYDPIFHIAFGLAMLGFLLLLYVILVWFEEKGL